jgi:hypothetical protein
MIAKELEVLDLVLDLVLESVLELELELDVVHVISLLDFSKFWFSFIYPTSKHIFNINIYYEYIFLLKLI